MSAKDNACANKHLQMKDAALRRNCIEKVSVKDTHLSVNASGHFEQFTSGKNMRSQSVYNWKNEYNDNANIKRFLEIKLNVKI